VRSLLTTLSKFRTKCVGERIVKIGQHLAKIWTRYGFNQNFGYGWCDRLMLCKKSASSKMQSLIGPTQDNIAILATLWRANVVKYGFTLEFWAKMIAQAYSR